VRAFRGRRFKGIGQGWGKAAFVLGRRPFRSDCVVLELGGGLSLRGGGVILCLGKGKEHESPADGRVRTEGCENSRKAAPPVPPSEVHGRCIEDAHLRHQRLFECDQLNSNTNCERG
jgi:hypothetical protein